MKNGHHQTLIDIKASLNRLKSLFGWYLLGGIIVWLLSGFYVVKSNEQGVVIRFGRVDRKAVSPGMHYRLPWPFETVIKPQVKDVRRVQVGHRENLEGAEGGIVQRLTGDINIINLSLSLQYTIKEATCYLFHVEDPEKLIRNVAEAVITYVAGRMSVDEVLTVGKIRIQKEIQLQTQNILDKYSCGLQILNVNLNQINPPKEVLDDFKSIINAQADKDSYISKARSYENMLIPKARGEAESILRQAEAYQENVINRAVGETRRFLDVLKEYEKAPKISKDRLYIEAMEKAIPRMKKCIIPPNNNMIKIYGVNNYENSNITREVIIKPWDDYDDD